MFPRKVYAIGRNVANVQFIIIVHMVGVGQYIDILKI
jgi:hypothetical protein